MSEDMLVRLERAERRVRRLTAGLFLIAASAGLGFAVQGSGERSSTDIVTATGIVIVDEAGRPRVVIGAPASAATDDSRFAQTTGVIVLDSLDRPSVALGTNPPLILEDGTLAERIGSSAGLTFYDPRDGKERGGIGAFSDGRANVCLDYGTGTKEAACMSVAPDDQYAAVMLNGTPSEEDYDRVGMFLGADGVGVLKAFGGLDRRDGVFIRAGGGMPTVTIYDSAQAEVFDLVERGSR